MINIKEDTGTNNTNRKLTRTELGQLDKEMENTLRSMEAPNEARKSEGDKKAKATRITLTIRKISQNEDNTVKLQTSRIVKRLRTRKLRGDGKLHEEDITKDRSEKPMGF